MINGNIELKKIYRSLRPAKAVTLVQKEFGWRDNCLKIIEMYSEIWGGEYNLIVPTDGETISEEFWYLLEKYDPDYFFTEPGKYSFITEKLKKEILKRVNPFYENIVGEDPIIDSLDPKNAYPLTFIKDIVTSSTNLDSITILNPNINFKFSKLINDNLRLMSHSVMGKMSDSYSMDLENKGLKVNKTYMNNFNELLGKILDYLPQSNEFNPFSSSMLNLEKYHIVTDYLKIVKSPVIVVIGDSIEDFCFYYNMSRLRYHVLWAPYSLIKTSYIDLKRFSEGKTKYEGISSFNRAIMWAIRKNISTGRNKDVIVTSISKSKKELEKVKIMLKESIFNMYDIVDSISISKNFKEMLNYKIKVYERNNHPNWYNEQFLNFKALNPVRTPTPRNFNHDQFNNHYWITEIAIEGYVLPQYANLNKVLNVRFYSNRDVRISKEGIAYFCPNSISIPSNVSIDHYLVRPELNLLKPLELFSTIFENAGYQIELSDDGVFEKKIIEKLDSLMYAAIEFSDAVKCNLFNNLIEEKNPENSEDGISINKRMYLSVDTIRKHLWINDNEKEDEIAKHNFIDYLIQKNVIYERMSLSRDFIIQISSQNTEKEIDEMEKDRIDKFIDYLIERKIIHRGFIFKCRECFNADWYNLNEIDNEFSCKRCGKTTSYNSNNLFRQKDSLEPQWFYKLDEVFYQGYKQNVIVPILTLYNLESRSESFIYINQIKLKKKTNPDKNFMEIDICCISDGEIIIGECKKSNTLTKKEIKKYKQLYYEIGAKKLIFSTFDENGWSKGTLKNIEDIIDKNINLTLINKHDLCSILIRDT